MTEEPARRAGQTLAQKRRDRRGTCAVCGRPIYRLGVSDNYAHIGVDTRGLDEVQPDGSRPSDHKARRA